jgi:hypothetical protein
MDNSFIKLYVNGVLEASTTVTYAGYDYAVGKKVYLGGSNEVMVNTPFNGTIDNVKFYNVALTANQINELYLLDPSCAALPAPNCDLVYYELDQVNNIANGARTVKATSWATPTVTNLTPLVVPPNATGLAIGPSFSFTAPNPTYWIICGDTYWYHNGYQFINTGHSSGPAFYGYAPGGSKNFLYSLGGFGSIYVYNGTSNATLLTSLPFNVLYGTDLVGDDLDNFYVLSDQSPPSLNIYNSLGALTCSYTLNGLLNVSNIAGLAVNGNTINVLNGFGYSVGTFSGSTINFTLVPNSFSTNVFDFGSCMIKTAFSSSINSSPSNSISCHTPTITLVATTNVSPVSYTWTGPGILTSPNNQSVQVNMAGLYTCSLTSCPGGTSVAFFNVQNGPVAITPTISSTGSISCTNPTQQLSVLPNTLTYTTAWYGLGVTGTNNTPTVTINSGGTYSVALTNTLTQCVGTKTIFVPSSISVFASNSSICSGNSSTLTAGGSLNYTWSPGGTTNSMIVVSPSVTSIYTLTASNGLGCTLLGIFQLSVTTTPTLLLSALNPSICLGASKTLSVSGATTYTWNPGNISGASATVSPNVTTFYTVIGANGFCNSSATSTLLVNPGPVLNPMAPPLAICYGTSGTLQATNAVSYTWQPGNLSGPSVTVTPLVNTIYTVSGSNTQSCVSTSTLNVQVYTLPSVSVTPASATVCNGLSTTLFFSGSTTNFFLNGASVGSSHTFSVTSNAVYSLVGYNFHCPSAPITISVTSIPNPTLIASVSNSFVCKGFSNTLTAVGNAASYSWSPIATDGSTVIHSPTVTTIYTVAGTSSLGCITTKTVLINVDTPTLAIGPLGFGFCAGGTVTLYAGGAVNYTWNPGVIQDATIAVSPSITSSYTVIGTSAIGCTNSAVLPITVYPIPSVSISATPSLICSGSSTTLNASGGALFYTWYPGSIVSPSLLVSPLSSAAYTAIGLATGSCTNIAVANVSVNPSPTVFINSSASSICSGQTATFSASGASSYTWQASVVASSIVVSPLANTLYTVTGALGNCLGNQYFYLPVNPNPTITAVSLPSSVCSGATCSLSAMGANSYTWNPGNNVGQTISVIPLPNTQYTITGINAMGCKDSVITNIIVNANPTISIITSPSLICNGNPLSIIASGASTYTWYPGNLNGSSISITPLVNTTYSVSGHNSSNCMDTKTISLLVNSSPTISITYTNNLICAGETVILTANGASSYTWNSANVGVSTIAVTPTANTNYTVSGVGINGCTSNAAITLTISECTALRENILNNSLITIYPNPNNGEFTIDLNEFSANTHIEVYNIFGELIMKQTIDSLNHNIDIQNLANGSYLVLIMQREKVIKKSIIVKE